MGLLFASPAPPQQAERQTGFALRQRLKSPKAASNLQFERPWDRLVPAKSARKLTAPMGMSKKFWRCADTLVGTQGTVECAVLSASEAANQECKSAEDSGHYNMHVSADH